MKQNSPLKKISLIIEIPNKTSVPMVDAAEATWERLGYTKGAFKRALRQGHVYAKGRRLERTSKLLAHGNEPVDVYLTAQDLAEAKRASVPTILRILYEDDGIVCFDKPDGLPTQPTVDTTRPNLYDLARAQLQNVPPSPNENYLGLHHRLDRDTSGVVLFTKDKSYNKSIADQFAEHTCKKTYMALVHGSLLKPQGRLESFLDSIGRIGRTKVEKFGSVRSGGKKAITDYQVITTGPRHSLIQVALLTGRTHQIRVHLSEEGHPIVGDTLYGSPSLYFEQYGRFMLHAHTLEFIHPVTQNPIRVESPVPELFRTILESKK